MSLRVACCDMAAPDDEAALDAVLSEMRDMRRVAVLVRCAGHAGPDDWSRRLARRALQPLLDAHGLRDRSVLLLAGGCEGIATPCAFVIGEDGLGEVAGPPRATLGLGRRPAPVGSEAALMAAVQATVTDALGDAALSPEQASLAIVKLSAPRGAPGGPAAHRMRALAALAAGAALGDLPPERAVPAAILTDFALFSRRVMSFAGADQPDIEACVLGQRPGAGGDLIAASGLLDHIADARGLKRLLRAAGVGLDADGEPDRPERVALLLIKGGVAPDGRVLGAPTTIFNGSTPPDAQMRAALSGLVGGMLATTRFFASADPVQQAPVGGGIAACLVQAGPARVEISS